MSDFDPYKKWFGIQTDGEVPNHYALLGVQPSESDPDVIEAAAQQRILFLKSLQQGPRGALAESICNDVVHARRVLLDPSSRIDYDLELELTGGRTPDVRFSTVQNGSDRENDIKGEFEATNQISKIYEPGTTTDTSKRPEREKVGSGPETNEPEKDAESTPGVPSHLRRLDPKLLTAGSNAATPPARKTESNEAKDESEPEEFARQKENDELEKDRGVENTVESPRMPISRNLDFVDKCKQFFQLHKTRIWNYFLFIQPAVAICILVILISFNSGSGKSVSDGSENKDDDQQQATDATKSKLDSEKSKPNEESKKREDLITNAEPIEIKQDSPTPTEKELPEKNQKVKEGKKIVSTNPKPAPEVVRPSGPDQSKPGVLANRKEPNSRKDFLPVPSKERLATLREIIRKKYRKARTGRYLADAIKEFESERKYALFEFAMFKALSESQIELLIFGFDQWSQYFDVKWETELLDRVLTLRLSDKPNVQQSLVSRLPYLLSECRKRKCVRKGLQLCAFADVFADRNPIVNREFVDQQLEFFRVALNPDEFLGKADQALYEALFYEQLFELNAKKIEVGRSFLTSIRSMRSAIDRFENKMDDASKTSLDAAMTTVKNEFTLLQKQTAPVVQRLAKTYVDEVLLDRKLKVAQAFNETPNLDLQAPSLADAEVHQCIDIKKLYAGNDDGPVLFRHRTSHQSSVSPHVFRFVSVRYPRLVLRTPHVEVIDPLTRHSTQYSSQDREANGMFAFGQKAGVSYMVDGDELHTFNYENGKSYSVSFSPYLNLIGADSQFNGPGEIISSIKPIGILRKDKVFILSNNNLMNILRPTSERDTLPQKVMPYVQFKKPSYGFVTDQESRVAFFLDGAVRIYKMNRSIRSYSVAEKMYDASFGRPSTYLYACSPSTLRRFAVNEYESRSAEFYAITKVKPISADRVVIGQNFCKGFCVISVVNVANKEPIVIHQIVADRCEFDVSSNGRYLAARNGDEIEIYSIGGFPKEKR